MRIGLEHGWIRAFVLYRRKEPIAFWLCAVYGDVNLLKTTGSTRRMPATESDSTC